MSKPKILFYTPILEYPPAGGPQLRVVNAIKALNKISDLHIITNVSSNQMSHTAQFFFRENSSALTFTTTNQWNSVVPYFQKILRRTRKLFSPAFGFLDALYIAGYAKKNGINFFWMKLEHSFYDFYWLRKLLRDAFIVADTDSVYSLFILRELPLIKNPIRWITVWCRGKIAEIYQHISLKEADVITAVSEVDAEFYRTLASEPEKVMRFSNVVDLTDYLPLKNPQPTIDKPALLLLGSYGHINSPMDRAARWIVNEIMPLVWNKVPESHLYIIGRNSHHTLSDLQGIRVNVVGQVDSVLSYLSQASATLVPLRYESGTRFKILESGAASVACVSTSLGAEGLDVIDKNNIIIADDVKNFSDAICNLLLDTDLANKIGNNLYKLVSSKYSIEVQIKEGKSIVDRFSNRHLKV